MEFLACTHSLLVVPQCERARVLQSGDQRAAHLGDQLALVAERVCNVGRDVDEAVGGAARAVQWDCGNPRVGWGDEGAGEERVGEKEGSASPV